MKSILRFTLLAIIFIAPAAQCQTNITSDLAVPFCLGITYTSTPGSNTAVILEPSNDYNCLSSSPNPSWYFLKCDQGGTIDLGLSAPQDIDFIIYGPYSGYSDILNYAGNHTNVVDCSYSATNNETPTIPGMNSGDYYVLLVTNYASSQQDITLIQTGGTGSLDCSVYSEGGLHFITGEVFYDHDQNGIKDSNDYGIPLANLQAAPTVGTYLTNSNGSFGIYNQTPDSIDYTVSADVAGWSPTNTNPELFWLDTTNAVKDSLMFGMYPDSAFYAVKPFISGSIVSCVQNSTVCISLLNIGTLDAQGNISLTIDSLQTYVSSSIPIDSIGGNELYFSIDSLQLYQLNNFCVILAADTSLSVGDTITLGLDVELLDTLGNPAVLYSESLTQAVVCSFDPNYKEMVTSNIVMRETIGPVEEITYVIHFQNTGTAPAVDVRLEDQIDPNLDLTTINVISWSHSVSTIIDSTNKLIFKFDDINLPDSTTNEAASHGYIAYTISPIGGLVPNDQIHNTASIFFDYNWPIVTNTTQNTIECYIAPIFNGFTVNGSSLETGLTNPDYTYEWYLDGQLQSENGNSISLTSAGFYELVISNQYGCQITEVYSHLLQIEDEEQSFSIQPNPSSQDFYLNFEGISVNGIAIYDEAGRLVFKKSVSGSANYIINNDELSKGVYLIQLTLDDNSVTQQRIVKL